MSEDCDCDSQKPKEAEVRVGELYISVEGETKDDAVEGAVMLWKLALNDIDDMSDEIRNEIGVQ